jgi:RNA recognition motif-containing protein
MNIYVGNLSHDATEQELRQEFEAFGQVKSVKIISDRETGEPRGFGFVEMANDAEGQAAINELNGKDFKGRPLRVNVGRPKEERQGGGGGDRRPFGGGGGGRGRGRF